MEQQRLTSERWRQVKQIFQAAVELSGVERAAYLTDACAEDPSMLTDIVSLIAAHERPGSFLDTPAIDLATESAITGQSHPLAGQSLGHYQILSLLGKGGMGEVYLAQDTRLNRRVALKLLPAQFTRENERVRRFIREAQAASALNHPNIITIHEIGQASTELGGVHFIAEEFVEGQTLRQRLAGGRPKLIETIELASQISAALNAAHDAGIVHRDIKPENVMVRHDGYVKVLDFGLAKLTERQREGGTERRRDGETEEWRESDFPSLRLSVSPSLRPSFSTDPGTVMGTASYMSPEQARGLEVDARADIFSLGVVLHEMIAGEAPFGGVNAIEVMGAMLNREPAPLSQYNADASAELQRIVTKALRKNRDERYQTSKDLLFDLKSLKQELEFEARRKSFSASGRQAAPPDRRRSSKAIDSLAVLPLANTSADPTMEYFSDGITESIIDALSRLPELRVMAWSTVSHYRGRQIDPRDAGRNLDVRAVLTGRIIQLGERLVIKTELVDAADGSYLLGESYDCKPSDILEIEAEIAREISEKLLLRLTGEERKRLAKRYTDNTEAYHAYLKGRYFWNKRTDESVRQGIEYFKQAIEIDPNYALAYAGLADSYVILGSFGIATLPPGEAFPKAREAAARALEIDDLLAEAHASLAISVASYDRDWPAAEREFKRSIELKPGYATARHWYGFIYLAAMGRLDEAIAEVRRAHELDPLSITISSDLGLLLYLARQYDQAMGEYQKTLEMDQNFVYSHWKLGLAYEQKAMYEEAIAEFRKAIALSGRSLLPLAQLGHAYAVSGKRDEALAVLGQLNELSKRMYVSSYRTAMIYAGLGQRKQAFEWLERAYDERDPWLIWLKRDPVVEGLRSDPRFTNLLRRMGLAGDSQPAETVSRSNAPSSNRAAARKRPARKAITSLAILPLANTSGDPSLEYLSDGITESVINTLSQLPKLRVVARNTVFRYKTREVDLQEIGRELGVQAALTGRVHQIADRLIISIELIDVTNDSQLWGERYNRNLPDIFEVQEEIAKEITEKLRLKLTRKEKSRLAKRHTHNVEAYQAHLKGRYFWNKRTTESLNKGVEHFKQAIDSDPAYAPAYAGLSDSYTLLVVREAISPEEGFAKAKAAASMALRIDEAFAEAHASLGHAMLHNWEWDEAERELKRAIELNPGYPSARHWYSEHLTAMGRCDESIAELKLAAELDPLSLVISADLGRAYYYAREYDQVMKQEARTLEMDSNFWLSHINLGRSYTQKGMHAEAIDKLRQARELSVGNTEVLSFLGFAYAAAGKRDEALKTLRELDEQSKRNHVPPYHFAIVHAGLGEKDRAFEWLEHAFENRAVGLFTLKVEPMFDGLRSDPRFEDLLRRVGLLR